MQNLKVGDVIICRIYTKGLKEEIQFDGEVVTGRVFETTTPYDPVVFIEDCKIETSNQAKRNYFNRFFKDDLVVYSKEHYEEELSRGIVGEFAVFERLMDTKEFAIPETRETFTAGEKVWCPFISNEPLELEDSDGFLKAKGYPLVFDAYGTMNAGALPMLFKMTEENHLWLLEIFGVDMQGLPDWEAKCKEASDLLKRTYGIYDGMVLLTSEPCELTEYGYVADANKALQNGAILMDSTTWKSSTKYNNFRFVLKVQM